MPTQKQIADHLDLSQPSVGELMSKLNIDWKTTPLEQIRIAYIRHLRSVAAGHRSDDGLDLTRERVMTERVDRELKMLQVAEKRGVLINVEQLEPELMNMVGAFRTELLSRDDKLAGDLFTLYGIQVDVTILNEFTFAALEQFSRYDPGSHSFAGATGVGSGAAGTTDDNGVGA